MTTSITVRVNGSYVREVTVGDAAPVLVGPGNSIEKTFQHGECADKVVTVGAERSATAEEIEAAKPKGEPGHSESGTDPRHA